MVSFEYVNQGNVSYNAPTPPKQPSRSKIVSSFWAIASLLDDPSKRRMVALSVPLVSFGTMALYRTLRLEAHRQKRKWDKQKRLRQTGAATAALVESEEEQQQERNFYDALNELTKFFGISLLTSLAVEELASRVHLRGVKPSPLLSVTHALIPLSVAYYLSQHQQKEMPKDVRFMVLQSESLKSGLKNMAMNKKLWLQIVSVSALQVFGRVILPYMSSHEDNYSGSLVLRNLIRLYRWEQSLTSGRQLEQSVDNLTLRVLAQFIDQVARESQMALATYCAENVWNKYVGSKMNQLGDMNPVHKSLLSTFMRVGYYGSIFVQGLRNFSLTDTSLDGSVVSPFSVAVELGTNYVRSYLISRMFDWQQPSLWSGK